MKLTATMLRKIIKEEVQNALSEGTEKITINDLPQRLQALNYWYNPGTDWKGVAAAAKEKGVKVSQSALGEFIEAAIELANNADNLRRELEKKLKE